MAPVVYSSHTKNNNNNNTSILRPLLEPTEDVPWIVDAVGAIPVSVTERIKQQQQQQPPSAPLQSAVAGRWHVVMTTATITTAMPAQQQLQYQLSVWYSSSTATLVEQKKNPHVVTLSHPSLTGGCGTTTRNSSSSSNHPNHSPRLAVVAPREEDCYLYVVSSSNNNNSNNNTANPLLLLWKLQRHDLPRLATATTTTTTTTTRPSYPLSSILKPVVTHAIRLAAADDDDDNETTTISSLTVEWYSHMSSPRIMLGTSTGHVYWVVQDHVPLHLRSYWVDPTTSATSGFFSSLLSSVSYKGGSGAGGGMLGSRAAIVTTVPWNVEAATAANNNNNNNKTPSDQYYASLNTTGTIAIWNVDDRGGGANVRFQVTETFDLVTLLRDSTPAAPPPTTHVSSCRVQAAVTVLDHVHILLLTTATRSSTSRTQPPSPEEPDEYRLYWVTLNCTTSHNHRPLRSATWLNRFVAPETIEVAGFVAATNGVVYAAFQSSSSSSGGIATPVIFMACTAPDMVVTEVDLLRVLNRLIPGSLAPDGTTHGVTALDRLGLGLRVRWLMPDPTEDDYETSTTNSAATGTTRAVPRLTRHLVSEYWTAYHNGERPSVAIQSLPPSLEHAATADLEAACLAAAQQLRDNAVSGGRRLDHHHELIQLLFNTGLYRRLSTNTKWSLLAIGQEISVFEALQNHPREQQQQPDQAGSASSWWWHQQLPTLQPHAVGEWLHEVQRSVLEDAGCGQDRLQSWHRCWHMVLETAFTYRHERGTVTYDVSSRRVPRANSIEEIPIWTCSPWLRQVAAAQFKFWHADSAAGQSSQPNLPAVSTEEMHAILEYMIQACGDAYTSCGATTTESRDAYIEAQRVTFLTIRRRERRLGDAFLFRLAQEHRMFHTLCQIAHDHELRRDADQFALTPLFRTLALQPDIVTGQAFGPYVLKWFTDQGLFGQVLEYGKECPDDLLHVLRTVDALAPYQWIYAARQGDYNMTAEALVQQQRRQVQGQQPVSVRDASVTVHTASLANAIVEQDSSFAGDSDKIASRRRFIDQRTDLIQAQQMLLGENNPQERLWDATALLDHALQKLDQVATRDEHVDLCETALVLCTTLDDVNASREYAQLVWVRALTVDAPRWTHWIHYYYGSGGAVEPPREDLGQEMLQETIWGRLLQLTSSANESDLSECVGFRSVLLEEDSDGAWKRWAKANPLLRQPGLRRLLLNVVALVEDKDEDESHRRQSVPIGETNMVIENDE